MKASINNKAKVRREKIINAARELFFQRGYKDTAIASIAKLANYSKWSVYLDFKSKDDLFISICAEGLEILCDELRKIKNEKLPYEKYLIKANQVFFKFSEEHQEYFRMNYKEASPEILANCTDAIRKRTAELEQACIEIPVDFVKKGIQEKAIPPMDPKEAALIFVAASTGVLLLSITGNQTLIQEKDIEALIFKALKSVKDGFQFQANEYYQNTD